MSNFMRAIEPKSDQLNAEQLIGGPITITITRVDYNFESEQKMIVHYEGENGRPWKPCKTMMKLMGNKDVWGPDEQTWVGRSVTLYRDGSVKFGRDETGGIRISHMSGISGRLTVTLMVRRGQYQKFTVTPLKIEQANGDQLTEHKNALSLSVGGGIEALKAAWGKVPRAMQPQLEAHKNACKGQIDAQAASASAEPEPQQGFTPAAQPAAQPAATPEPTTDSAGVVDPADL